MKSCPTCGATYDDVVRLCPKDGSVLEGSTEAPDPRIGETLDGKYRLDGRLGQGGMGAIYRATHLMLDKQVAVKLIKPELVGSPDLVRRFQREARAAGNLNHPNIAAAYDLGQTADGTLYIAMELVRGRSLKDVIREAGPLSVDRIVRILRQIGSALALAHRHNIIHRDLKPHNVMLASDGRDEVAKLLDFGIAKTFDEASTQLTATGFVLGTPQYMSPEQAAGRPIDGRSDLYSLGIILYEMLTGEVPFNDPSTPALLVKHLTETPAPPSARRPDVEVPAVLETIVLRLLAKDPADRFQTADELLTALPAETGTGTAAVAAPTSDRTIVLPPPGSIGGATPVPAADPTMVVAPPTRGATAAPAPGAPAASTTPTPVASTTAPPSPAPAPSPRATVPNVTPPNPPAPPTAAPQVPAAVAAATARASSTSTSRSLVSLLVLVGLMVLIVVGGAFAGMRLGWFGGRSAEPSTTAEVMPLAAGTDTETPTGDVVAGTAADPAAAPPTTAGNNAPADGVPAATGTTATSTAAASRPASQPSSTPAAASGSAAGAGTTPAPAAPPAQQAAVTPARPATPAVSFSCDGAPQVCGALRSAMTDALGRHSLRPVTGAANADVRVTASVSVVDESSEELFGSTFVIRTYSVEFSGETRDGDQVPMPAPTTLTFDAAYAQQKLPQDARTMSTDAAGHVRTYWRSLPAN